MTSIVAKQIIEIEDRGSAVLNRIATAVENIEGKLDKVGEKSKEVEIKTKNSFKQMLVSGLKMASSFAAVYIGTKSTFGYLVERSKYLVSMQNILHATSEQMNNLGKTMNKVSKDSVVSMSEMYHGTFELSRRLRNVDLVSASIEHVKNIAGATKQGFTEAAQVYGDLYSAFEGSIKSGNTTLQDIADEVAYSFDKTKGNLGDFLQFIQMTTSNMQSNNVSLKESASIYANLLKAGYGGSMAGTRTNALMLELGNIKKRAMLAKNLGISFKDLDIKQRGFINVLETINNKTEKLTETQKKAKLQSVISPMAESTLSFFTANIKAIKEYINAQDKAKFAEKSNARILNSTYGAWERLKNSLISTGESFVRWDPFIAGILNTVTSVWEVLKNIASLDWLFNNNKNIGKSIISDVNDIFEEDYLKDLKNENTMKPKKIRAISIKNEVKDIQNIIKQNELNLKTNNTNFSINQNKNEVSIKVELETKDKNLKAEAKDIKVNNSNISNVKIEKRNFNNF